MNRKSSYATKAPSWGAHPDANNDFTSSWIHTMYFYNSNNEMER